MIVTCIPKRIQPSNLQLDPLIAAANFRACMAKINDEEKDKTQTIRVINAWVEDLDILGWTNTE